MIGALVEGSEFPNDRGFEFAVVSESNFDCIVLTAPCSMHRALGTAHDVDVARHLFKEARVVGHEDDAAMATKKAICKWSNAKR